MTIQFCEGGVFVKNLRVIRGDWHLRSTVASIKLQIGSIIVFDRNERKKNRRVIYLEQARDVFDQHDPDYLYRTTRDGESIEIYG